MAWLIPGRLPLSKPSAASMLGSCLVSFTVPGYTVYERLGIGARSTLWLVGKRETGEQMVLKRVLRRSAEDNRFLVQAENEFTISSQFRHPYLRRSFDIRRVRKLLTVKELHLFM